MKKNLMSLVVAGSWVLWASAANAEITMKLTGCPPEVADWDYGSDWWVDTDSGPEDAIYDIAEDGTFTTEVPEGTELLAAPTGCKSGLVKKWKTVNQTVDYGCDVEGGPLGIGPTSPWTPAKDGGVLIISGENCMGGLGELGDID